MKRLTVLVSAALVLTMTSAWRYGDADDNRDIQGDWKPIKGDIAGQQLPDQVLQMMMLSLHDGKYTLSVGPETENGTYVIDVAASPKTIDISATDGPNPGQNMKAIYTLTGDTLQVCFDLSGASRPSEFTVAGSGTRFLVTYLRTKS